MIQTGWLPSALEADGPEDREAQERFGITTEYRAQRLYNEVRVSGDLPNVVRAISEWWESGVEEDDLAFIQWAVSGLTQKEI